MFVEKLI